MGDSSLKNRCGGALSNSVYKVTRNFPPPPPHPNDARPLLALVMIVKDEAHTLPNTLKGLAPFIDTYYILDTGSKDGTQDAIRRTLGKDKGEIWEEPFIDYGRSRNRALEIAQTAKNPPIFSLMLSADETVHNPQALRKFCEEYRNAEGAMHEAYPIQMDVGWKFDSVRLSRTEKGWRYVGRVHEYLAAPDQKWRPSLRVPDAWIQFQVTDPERRSNREYTIRDILLEEVRDKPRDTRASFYLARTYNVIRNHTAALAEFRRRISLGGWAEEIYESYYAIAFQKEALGEPWPVIAEAFLEAHNYAPDRGEPLFNIAQHYYVAEGGAKRALAYPYAAHCASLPYPKDAVLWVQAAVYEYQCLMYQGLTGVLIKSQWGAGYTALLKALKKRPGDGAMQAAKVQYETKLSAADKAKAECQAGVSPDVGACSKLLGGGVSLPCTPSSAGAPAASLSSQLGQNAAHTPEQSNYGVRAGDAQSHIPSSLRGKYAYAPDFNMDSSPRQTLAILFFALVGCLACALFILQKMQLLNWIQLKLFGGKRSKGGSSLGIGGKHV